MDREDNADGESTPEEQNQKRHDELLARWLEAFEAGLDITEEVLTLAGESRKELEASLDLERELRAMPESLGFRLIGNFRILGELGRGGIGVVYLALDQLGRRIALKVLNENIDRDSRTWILNEAKSLAKLNHPNVVKVYEVGEADSVPYFAMELLDGPSLRSVLNEWLRQRDGGGQPGKEKAQEIADRLRTYSKRLEALVPLAEALAYCHDNGVLHRDIKPENVLLDAAGTPKFIDLGLAFNAGADQESKLNLTQSLVGTPAYVAPEQVENGRAGADPRSDQFVFATVLYECFALENPFRRHDNLTTLEAVRAADVPPLASKAPAVSPDLAIVIRRAQDLDPDARYSSMAAMVADLRAIVENRPIAARSPTAFHSARLWARRHHRGVRAASGAFALALAAMAVIWGIGVWRERARLLEEAERIRPEEFLTQEEFGASYPPLHDLQQTAQESESSLLRRTLWPGARRGVDAIAQRWSQELHRLLEDETLFRADNDMPPPQGQYPQLFMMDSILCPDAPWNEEARARGRVVIEAVGRGDTDFFFDEYLKRPPPDSSSRFVEVQLTDYPDSATHRVQVPGPDGELWGETVFYKPQGWPPLIHVLVHPPLPVFWDQGLDFKAATVELPNHQGTVEVLDFRILGHVVTRGEFEEFLALTTGEKRAMPSMDEAERPATVTVDQALAFGAWVGGRLPTLAELVLAREAGIPGYEDAPLEGELVLDINPGGTADPSWFHYKDRGLRVAQRQFETRIAGFRIAFSTAKISEYRRLANAK